jgi:hypothetical protein
MVSSSGEQAKERAGIYGDARHAAASLPLRLGFRLDKLRHAKPPTMSGPPPDARRVEMPDGTSWRVVRRHEMARIRTRRDTAERKLYVLFFADDGRFRRAEIPADFADPATAPVSDLVDLWRVAEESR